MSGGTAVDAQLRAMQTFHTLPERKAQERENAASLAIPPAPQAQMVPKPCGVCGVSTSKRKKEKGSKRKAVKRGVKVTVATVSFGLKTQGSQNRLVSDRPGAGPA